MKKTKYFGVLILLIIMIMFQTKIKAQGGGDCYPNPPCFCENTNNTQLDFCNCLGQFTETNSQEYWETYEKCALKKYSEMYVKRTTQETDEDKKRLFNMIRVLAYKNNAKSYFKLAYLYMEGKGILRDYDSAEYYFKRAIIHGQDLAAAYSNIGLLYEFRYSTSSRRLNEKDKDKMALEYYRKASAGGQALGHFKVGSFFEQGRVVRKNFDSAFFYYTKSQQVGFNISPQKIDQIRDSIKYLAPFKKLAEELKNQMVLVESGQHEIRYCEDNCGQSIVDLVAYRIGKFEVTQRQWKIVMGNNPSIHVGDNLPVHNVNWFNVQNFISKLNSLSGYNFRLPTEAEWEFAAKGGNYSRNFTYSGSNNYTDVASEPCKPITTPPVGQPSPPSDFSAMPNCEKPIPVNGKMPNELGIYNMTANVSEWCSDWYYIDNENLRHGEGNNIPSAYQAEQLVRLSKGGSNKHYFFVTNSGYNYLRGKGFLPLAGDGVYIHVGFRLVLTN